MATACNAQLADNLASWAASASRAESDLLRARRLKAEQVPTLEARVAQLMQSLDGEGDVSESQGTLDSSEETAAAEAAEAAKTTSLGARGAGPKSPERGPRQRGGLGGAGGGGKQKAGGAPSGHATGGGSPALGGLSSPRPDLTPDLKPEEGGDEDDDWAVGLAEPGPGSAGKKKKKKKGK